MRAGDDMIIGSATSKEISGYAGDDTIHGGAGNDTLVGGTGKDNFIGGSGQDLVSFVGGTHEAVADMSLTTRGILDDGFGNVETMKTVEGLFGTVFGDSLTGNTQANLLLGDFGNDSLSGGAGNDTLDGGSSNDVLFGGSGADVLLGRAGLDTITGGADADIFVFADVTPILGADTITDMTHGVDKIKLNGAWSLQLSGTTLTADQFLAGAGADHAVKTQQVIIYDTATGDLYFDRDGSATVGAPVLIATLSNLPNLSFQDFLIL